MFEATKAFCDSFLTHGVPGFDLCVYKDGECVLRYINGYSDLENKIPTRGDERYNIYSCSKVITCTAALQLMERGLFSLEDRLSDYMPEFENMTVRTEEGLRPARRPILIRHLFEMTAGFSYNCSTENLKKAYAETDGKCPTRVLMRYLAKDPLLFDPGDRWAYSLCHDVLAALVEVLSGEKFEDYVKKNIFDKAGMHRSTFMLPDSELPEIAEQYTFSGGNRSRNVGKGIVTYKLGSEYASGGAGCISTVEDYITFLEALRTHKLLKPETLTLMTTPRLSEAQQETYSAKENFGYGLGVRCPRGVAAREDFGWGGAACAYLAVDMKHGISMYFGTHALSSPIQGIRSMLYRFVRAELFYPEELPSVLEELKKIHGYRLTY